MLFAPGDRVIWRGYTGGYGNTGVVRAVRVVDGIERALVYWDTVNRESEWPSSKLERWMD